MEKTNELNKFLSYIHMGNSVFRIYYNEAKNLNDQNLIELIVEIEEIFKKHEEKITNKINELGETATDSLTAAGLMAIYKEKMKFFDTPFSIILSAIKSTNMGLISSLKFLNDNNDLHKNVKDDIISVINDYKLIQSKLINYLLVYKFN